MMDVLKWVPLLILVVLILILLIGNIVIVSSPRPMWWSGWERSGPCGAWDCT